MRKPRNITTWFAACVMGIAWLPHAFLAEVVFEEASTAVDHITRTSWIHTAKEHHRCPHPYHYGAIIHEADYPDILPILPLIVHAEPVLSKLNDSQSPLYQGLWFKYTNAGGHFNDIQYRYTPLFEDPIHNGNRHLLPSIIHGIRALDLTLWPNKNGAAINFANSCHSLEYLALPFHTNLQEVELPKTLTHLCMYNQVIDSSLMRTLQKLPKLQSLSIWGCTIDTKILQGKREALMLDRLTELRMFNCTGALQNHLAKIHNMSLQTLETDNQQLVYRIAMCHKKSAIYQETPNLKTIKLHFHANRELSLHSSFTKRPEGSFKPEIKIIIYSD